MVEFCAQVSPDQTGSTGIIQVYLTWINDYLHPEEQKKLSYLTYIKVTHKEVNKFSPALIHFSSIHSRTKFSNHMIKFCRAMMKQKMDF